MKAHTKAIAVIAAILLVLTVAAGLKLASLFRRPAPAAQAMNPFGPFFPTGSASPNFSPGGVNQAAVSKLMSQYGLDMGTATYLAQAKSRVISQSNTSIHLAMTFPDGLTADEIITIRPDQQYTPTPVELEAAARTGRQIYDVKFSAMPQDTDKTQITLQYFVPYSSLPPELQQTIHAQTSSAGWFELVPSAWAQNGGGAGAGMGVSTAFGVGKTAIGSLSSIISAAKKSEQNQNWMDQLDTLQNCAQHPTNPMTQKAYRDNPVYQQQTVAGVQQARSEVQQATAARFMTQETTVAAGLLGGPWGMLLAPIASWSDRTLKDVAEQQIKDIGKSVVNCQQPTTPPDQEPSDGTIVYSMHREHYLDFDEENRLVQGKFNLRAGPVAGTVLLTGTGSFQTSTSSSKDGTSSKCKGRNEIGGGGYSGDFQISSGPIEGDCEFNNRGRIYHTGAGDSASGFICTFHGLDFVNGGSYSGNVEGLTEDARYATCKLELAPRQR